MNNKGKYGEIKNTRIFGEEPKVDSPVITYTLSPEELAKYQRGDQDMSFKQKMQAPPKEELEKLIIEYNGVIDSMAKAKCVGWPTMKVWLKEANLWDRAAEVKERVRQQRKQDLEAKKSTVGHTLKQDLVKEDEPTFDDYYADLYFVTDNNQEWEFDNLDDALDHIKTQYTLTEINSVRLFKEIPFTMNVNVVTGKVG